jgi:hypothetical protein
MGDLDAAASFVFPAYALTFVTFGLLALITIRRLRQWSQRAREDGHEE